MKHVTAKGFVEVEFSGMDSFIDLVHGREVHELIIGISFKEIIELKF